MGVHELNTWTTVSALNIGDLKNIQAYTNTNNIKHAWALLEQPEVLNIRHRNHFTYNANAPIELVDLVASGEDNSIYKAANGKVYFQDGNGAKYQQDSLRGIHYKDYFQ
jgi:hypothetical protein